MWIKIRGNLFNMNKIESFYKEPSKIVFYYSDNDGLINIDFETDKKRDLFFEKIEKELLQKKLLLEMKEEE